jgi:quercetin dioxygenase-like cupin family protein
MEKATQCLPTADQLASAVTSVRLSHDDIVMKNQADLTWEKMLPELGEDSPLFAILRIDPQTSATTLMIQFPKALHIPKHTHEKSETHIILGGAHVFEHNDSGKRFDVREHGYIYMPGHFVHEAWVPAGSKAVIILEDGWKVNWLEGPPTALDLGKDSPPE